MSKLAVVVPHLGSSQLAYTAINEVSNASLGLVDDACIFYEDLLPPCSDLRVAAMNVADIVNFRGTVITTSYRTTELVLNHVSSLTYYVWDLEWIRRWKPNYVQAVNLLRNPKVNLVSRSEYHARFIENYCNRKPLAVVPNFSLREIMNVLLRPTS